MANIIKKDKYSHFAFSVIFGNKTIEECILELTKKSLNELFEEINDFKILNPSLEWMQNNCIKEKNWEDSENISL